MAEDHGAPLRVVLILRVAIKIHVVVIVAEVLDVHTRDVNMARKVLDIVFDMVQNVLIDSLMRRDVSMVLYRQVNFALNTI